MERRNRLQDSQCAVQSGVILISLRAPRHGVQLQDPNPPAYVFRNSQVNPAESRLRRIFGFMASICCFAQRLYTAWILRLLRERFWTESVFEMCRHVLASNAIEYESCTLFSCCFYSLQCIVAGQHLTLPPPPI